MEAFPLERNRQVSLAQWTTRTNSAQTVPSLDQPHERTQLDNPPVLMSSNLPTPDARSAPTLE
jgi:hypothetical protein